MIYYAKASCMIDGRAFNGGEVVPEALLKHNWDTLKHLVRKEGESVTPPKPANVGLTSKAVAATVEDTEEKEEDTTLPPPLQASDKKGDDDKVEDTSEGKNGDTSNQTPAPKGGDAKKDSKDTNSDKSKETKKN